MAVWRLCRSLCACHPQDRRSLEEAEQALQQQPDVHTQRNVPSRPGKLPLQQGRPKGAAAAADETVYV